MHNLRMTARAMLACAGMTIFASSAFAQNGYVGIFDDALGTVPCTTIPQGTGRTLYVFAILSGATASGITGAEFRIEASNPAGWFLSYAPPSNSTPIGQALDLHPDVPDDGSGVTMAFAACQTGANDRVPLGTLGVFNLSGSSTTLAVKRHSNPSNAGYSCPLFTVCDSPVFTKYCMDSAGSGSCSLGKAVAITGDDPAVFIAGLNVIPIAVGPPSGPVPMPPDALVAGPVLLAAPEVPDIVGLGDGDGDGEVSEIPQPPDFRHRRAGVPVPRLEVRRPAHATAAKHLGNRHSGLGLSQNLDNLFLGEP